MKHLNEMLDIRYIGNNCRLKRNPWRISYNNNIYNHILTTSEFNLARLVVHGIFVEYHVTSQCQGQPLTVKNGSIRRESDESVWNGDGVERARFEIANEDVWGPHPVKLLVVQSDGSVVVMECQAVITPHLAKVQSRREFLRVNNCRNGFFFISH